MMRRRLAAALLLLAALAAPAGAEECLTVENFAKGKVGEFPPDWKPRKDAGLQVYSIQEMDGLRFLRGLAKNLGIQAAKQYEWDPKAYPMLAWAWRPVQFPKGSDERESGTNDSAVSVYALVPYSRISGPKAVKYIWSEKVPVGTRLKSNFGLTQVRVLRSGVPPKPEWVEERVNVLEDYKQYFGETEMPKPAGIAVLTDSDDTKSVAQGDYANFRVCKP